MFTIYSNLQIDHSSDFNAKFGVHQGECRTIVRNRITGQELTMPQARYSLACDNPASGIAGRAQFLADLEVAAFA